MKKLAVLNKQEEKMLKNYYGKLYGEEYKWAMDGLSEAAINDLKAVHGLQFSDIGDQSPVPKKVKKAKPEPEPPVRTYYPGDGSRWTDL